jgi:hypothetical protein
LKEVRTEIEIDASPEKVWKILTDFGRYDQWNPYIHKIIGDAKEGSKIRIHIETPSGKNRKYEPTITKVKEGREIRWRGKSTIPGFLNGEHVFMIEQLQPERSRFIQLEVFEGLLSSFFGKSLDIDMKDGLEEMNKALKKRVERNTAL